MQSVCLLSGSNEAPPPSGSRLPCRRRRLPGDQQRLRVPLVPPRDGVPRVRLPGARVPGLPGAPPRPHAVQLQRVVHGGGPGGPGERLHVRPLPGVVMVTDERPPMRRHGGGGICPDAVEVREEAGGAPPAWRVGWGVPLGHTQREERWCTPLDQRQRGTDQRVTVRRSLGGGL